MQGHEDVEGEHGNEHAQQHVYIQGVEEDDHDLILIGPSWRPLTEELRAAGHDPAAVIQVGPEYFETWIRLGEQAPRAKRLIIAEYLNWFHGVSDGSQDAPRRGYLAGFEYRAQEGSLPNGHYPRVHLLEDRYIAPRGRLLVQMAEELREEMSAARARDLQEDLEVERAIAEVEATNRDAREQIAEFTRLWFVAYEDKMLGELSEIDQTAVEAAFAHDVPVKSP
jgi:hypothetical protein